MFVLLTPTIFNRYELVIIKPDIDELLLQWFIGHWLTKLLISS